HASLRNDGPAGRGFEHDAPAANPRGLGGYKARADVGPVADADQPPGADRELLPPKPQGEPRVRAVEASEIEKNLLEREVTDVDRPGGRLPARLPTTPPPLTTSG